MPYARHEDKLAYMRSYLTQYVNENPEKIEQYRRNAIIRRAIQNGRPPTKHSIAKYGISLDEMHEIAQRMVTHVS